MHKYPVLHAAAIYQGVKSEKISFLIEDILEQRLLNLGGDANIDYSQFFDLDIKKKIKYSFGTSSKGYRFQNEIHERCGITYGTYFRLLTSNRI